MTWGIKRKKPLRRQAFRRKFPESPKMPANPQDLKRMSTKELDAILWTYFSIYIRKRDRISGDYCKCITCPKILHWKQMQAGHCVTRQCTPLKYHELNNHSQCEECNITNRGMFDVYIAKIRYLYSNDLADEFLRYKRACPIKIFTHSELIELIYKYKDLSEEP
jgi:hypothetical protein